MVMRNWNCFPHAFCRRPSDINDLQVPALEISNGIKKLHLIRGGNIGNDDNSHRAILVTGNPVGEVVKLCSFVRERFGSFCANGSSWPRQSNQTAHSS